MVSVHELQQQLAEIKIKIDSIQSECSHPKACLTSVPNSSTGNYSPSDDVYWIDLHCGLCDKRWREDQ